MFKRVISTITNKMTSASTLAKAAAGKIDAADVAAMVREEAVTVAKQMFVRYFLWMNIAFGFIGFLIGCGLTYALT